MKNLSLSKLVSSPHSSSLVVQSLGLYVVGFGLLLLLPNAYFWDDWFNYFGKSASEIRASTGPFSGFSPIRLVLEGWMAEYFPGSFRLLTFIAFPIAAYALWKVLSRSPLLNRAEASAVTLLFLLLPLNSARASMTIFMYTACNLCFFLGWWAYVTRRGWLGSLLSISLFLMSFDTASFIVFVSVPLTLSLIEHFQENGRLVSWLRKNLIFLAIGPAYWFVEPILNPTLDKVRAAYYTPSASGIARGLVVGMIVSAIPTWLIGFKKYRYVSHRWAIQISVGLVVTWVGMFPYMALGHFPNLNSLLIGFVPGASDWDSRHQLLMPLGLAIVIVGSFNALNSARLLRGVLVVGLLSTLVNLTFSQEYLLDSIKTDRIIRQFETNDDIQGVRVALIDDQALRFNARGRAIRSYEWDAMLHAANPDLNQQTDILRYVDCSALTPDAIITVTASHGKLRTLLTRDPGISVSVRPIQPCP